MNHFLKTLILITLLFSMKAFALPDKSTALYDTLWVRYTTDKGNSVKAYSVNSDNEKGPLPTAAISGSATRTEHEITFVSSTPGIFTIEVYDDNGTGTALKTFKMTVTNSAPTASQISNTTVANNEQVVKSFTIGDTETDDPANLTTTATWTASGLSGGTVPVTGTGSSRTVRFTPTVLNKVYTINYKVDDGFLSTSKSFTITATNTPPSISSLTDTILAVNSELNRTFTVTDTETPNSEDLTVTASWTRGQETGVIPLITNGDQRSLAFTPTETGEYTIEITASDEYGSTSESFTITATNTPPSISSLTDTTTGANSTLTRSFTVTDPEIPNSENITVTAQWTSEAASGVIPLTADGDLRTLSFTPAESGEYTVTITADDGYEPVTESFTLYVFAGGEGTQANPFLIGNVDDLQAIASDLKAHYALKNDIDASETKLWNSGKGFLPIGSASELFEGSLRGRGHVIDSLYINNEDTYVGLFVMTNNSKIDSLGMINCTIAGKNYVGAIAGVSVYSSINECYVTGAVKAMTNLAGGFTALSMGDTIRNCYSQADVSGSYYAAGFAACAEYSVITHCFYDGVVTDINTGDPVADAQVDHAGFMYVNDNAVLNSCFWNNGKTPSESTNGNGLTREEMKNIGSYTLSSGVVDTAWDFNGTFNDDQATNDIWYLDSVAAHPYLSYKNRVITYSVDGEGAISGGSVQNIFKGRDGTEVLVEPAQGYGFVEWSDGSTDNPRIDLNVISDLSLTAKIRPIQIRITEKNIRVNDTVTTVDTVYAEKSDTLVHTIRTDHWIDSLFIRTDSILGNETVGSKLDTTVTSGTTLVDTVTKVLKYNAVITVTVDSSHVITIDMDTTVDSLYAEKSDTLVTTVVMENEIDSLFVKTDSLRDGESYWFKIDTTVSVISKELSRTIDTLEYMPVKTVTVDSSHAITFDTVTTVDSVEASGDTVVTTIRTENTTDSLFVKTDSLSDGVSYWLNIDTSVTLSSTILDTLVDTIKGNAVAINVIEKKSIADSFLAYPNPVPQSNGEVLFTLPEYLEGSGVCTIFDAVGTVIDQQSIVISESSNLRWDLTNRGGQLVGSGSYVAVLKVVGADGKVSLFKTTVGIKK